MVELLTRVGFEFTARLGVWSDDTIYGCSHFYKFDILGGWHSSTVILVDILPVSVIAATVTLRALVERHCIQTDTLWKYAML